MSGVEEPSSLAVRLWYAFRARDWEVVATMLHPEAQLETALVPDRALSAEETLEQWRTAVEAGRFHPNPVGFLALDAERVLLIGALKPARTVGQADALVLTFKDGLLWRTRYYASAEEAQASVGD